MMGYEMIGVSDQNGRTYESKYGTYSKDTGFVLSDLSKSMIKEELLDNLFHENCWSLKQESKKMTREDIEKELGYKIEIVPEENKSYSGLTRRDSDNISLFDKMLLEVLSQDWRLYDR